MTQAVPCPSCPSLLPGFSGDGYSKEAFLLFAKYNETFQSDSETAESGSYKKFVKLLEELSHIRSDCSEEGWDGYNATPVSYAAIIDSAKLIQQLPKDIPAPELVPEPDGSIGLEWYIDQWHVLTLSVKGDAIIVFSGLFGGNDTDHGQKPLTEHLSATLRMHLNRLYFAQS